MNIFLNKLEKLIIEMKEEIKNPKSSFPKNQLHKSIDVFSDIRESLLLKIIHNKNHNYEIEIILRWSIDVWDWESNITKTTWEIIQDYKQGIK